jgi:hypothetical protein
MLDALSVSASDAQVRHASARAAGYWRQIARYESNRMPIYLAKRTSQRTSACIRLVFLGGYRSFRKGGLGARLLLKDVLAGVLHIRRRRD